MQVTVVGAGLTGLMTAYCLVNRGVSVTLLESRSSPCQGASYSCSGLLGEDNPKLIASEKTSLLGSRASIVYGAGLVFKHPRFSRLMQKARHPDRRSAIATLATTLSSYADEWYRQTAEREGWKLQESRGTLLILGKDSDKAPLQDWLTTEPSLYALPASTRIGTSSAISWSISYFAKQLKERLLSRGVTILNNTPAEGLVLENDVCRGVRSAAGTDIRADAVVVAAGMGAMALLRSAGIKPPMLPLTRCVLNTTIFSDAMRIHHAIIDELGYMLTPLQDFLRIQGRWYLGTEAEFDREAEYRALWERGMRIFPDIADWKNARYFSQTVLTTPDSLGIVGASPIGGLWLNIAGGLHGADFAPSYAETLTLSMTGETSPLAAELSLKRFD